LRIENQLAESTLMAKTLEEYLSLPYQLLITPDEDGFGIAVPDLQGCFSYAENWEDIPAMIHEAMELWIKVMLEAGKAIPEPSTTSSQTAA
jgi:predicted RNase H-like HicB family nuclease